MTAAGSDDCSCFKSSFHPVGDADDVAAGLALNVHDHRRRGVHPGGLLHIFGAVHRGGDIGKADGRAVVVSHHDAVVLRAGVELIIGADGERLPRAIQHPFGLVDVGGGERGPNVFQTQSIRSQRRGIGLNAHGRLLSAADRNQADAGQLRNFLGQSGVGEIFNFRQRQGVRSQGQRKNGRVCRIHLAVDRRIRQVARKISSGGVDRGLNLLFLDVNVLVEIELQRNDGAAQ